MGIGYTGYMAGDCDEPCEPCEGIGTVTCDELDPPSLIGVEFHGEVADNSDDCGEVSNSSGGPYGLTVASYGFPYYGTPIAVEFVGDENTCEWCLPDVGSPFEFPIAEPGSLDTSATCGAITGLCDTNRYLEYDSAGFGWQTHPSGVVCEVEGVCDTCDGLVSNRQTIDYDSANMPSVFTQVKVEIEKRTAADAPHFADGINVKVTKVLKIGGKQYSVLNETEVPIECDEDSRYDCGEFLILIPNCNDPPFRTWTCTYESVDISNVYERWFPGATSWSDIVGQEIPGSDISATISGTESCACEDAVDGVLPFFAYDHNDECLDNPPGGCHAGDYDEVWDYQALCAASTDNYVVLRDVAGGGGPVDPPPDATLLLELPCQDDDATTTVVATVGSNAALADNSEDVTTTGPGGSFTKAFDPNLMVGGGLSFASTLSWMFTEDKSFGMLLNLSTATPSMVIVWDGGISYSTGITGTNFILQYDDGSTLQQVAIDLSGVLATGWHLLVWTLSASGNVRVYWDAAFVGSGLMTTPAPIAYYVTGDMSFNVDGICEIVWFDGLATTAQQAAIMALAGL